MIIEVPSGVRTYMCLDEYGSSNPSGIWFIDIYATEDFNYTPAKGAVFETAQGFMKVTSVVMHWEDRKDMDWDPHPEIPEEFNRIGVIFLDKITLADL